MHELDGEGWIAGSNSASFVQMINSGLLPNVDALGLLQKKLGKLCQASLHHPTQAGIVQEDAARGVGPAAPSPSPPHPPATINSAAAAA